jgi:hypothetical protein
MLVGWLAAGELAAGWWMLVGCWPCGWKRAGGKADRRLLESWLVAAGRMLAVRMETSRRIGGSEAAGELAASCWLLESWLLAGGCWSDAGCADGNVLEERRIGGCWRAGCWLLVGCCCADGNVPEDRRIGGCWRAGCWLLVWMLAAADGNVPEQ